jgi:phospholipase/carboxylesterase
MHTYRLLEKGTPPDSAEKALILLHGRGASAEDIITLADEFCDDTYYIVAPRAVNDAWYPYSFLAPESQNEPWLSSAVATVKRLIDEISEHLPLHKIYLMGFSQGACLALEVSARYANRFAGVAAFSGGLIGDTIRTDKYHGSFDGAKIFIGNSDEDPHIPLIRTEESAVVMENLGADVTLKIYPGMTHTIIQDEIDTVRELMF